MYKGLGSLVVKVTDVEKAKQWYRLVFDSKPVFDTSFMVAFQVGDSVLAFSSAPDGALNSNDCMVPYWEVEDIDAEFSRLLGLGATVHINPETVLNSRRATIIDPFGNIMGIRTTLKQTDALSVAQQPSQTAAAVALARAAAAIDERKEIKGPDNLAAIFLSEDVRTLLEDNTRIKSMLAGSAPGMYEYIVARTRYFDDIVQQALSNHTSQIVILGAGYDTRAYRFKDLIGNTTKIFELDIPTTQARKMDVLKQHHISIPEQLTFVPIDFTTQTLDAVLPRYGYEPRQKSLFVCEGLSYYLFKKDMDDMLLSIKNGSPTGSAVCFDYAAIWPEMMNAHGVKTIMETMHRKYAGENTNFGLERGNVESYLAEKGYTLGNHMTAEEMEKEYLTLEDGSLAGRVVGLFCFAYAVVSSGV
jgi:methyltransferase (TIGR00027 family)